MTTKIITNYFRLHNVKQFRESINETANSVYYVFTGRHLPYANGDSTTESVINSVNEHLYTAYDEMLFGKRVSASDVCAVAPRYSWAPNTVYSAYRSNEDLTDKAYYVCVNASSSYHIFKCLDNNGNTASLYQPEVTQTSPDDDFYSTADGYVWKYMYSVDASTFNKFATADYMPVIANNQVVGNSINGSIDVIIVTTKGSNYDSYLSNTFNVSDIRVGGNALRYNLANSASANSGFYKNSFIYIKQGTGFGQGRKIVDYNVSANSKLITLESSFDTTPDVTSVYEITPAVLITGDGEGATARALVNSSSGNSIYQIEILTRGNNYTYATAEVLGNTGGVQNNAVLTIMLGPKGGHGADPEYELGASALCISATFANTESGSIPTENDFRTIGLIKDPLYANVELTVSSLTGNFTIGEVVTQSNTQATGVVTEFDAIDTLAVSNVNGVFVTGYTITGSTSGSTGNLVSYKISGKVKNFNTFDQRHRYTYQEIIGSLANDEQVYQTFSNGAYSANAYVHSAVAVSGSGNLYLTHVRGTLNTANTLIGTENSGGGEASANLIFYYPPDLVVGSGEVLYVENRSPISRANTQSETVKLILQF